MITRICTKFLDAFCSEILTHRVADRRYLNVHLTQADWRAICPNTANNSHCQYKLERPRRLLIVRLVIPGGEITWGERGEAG